MSTKKEIFAAPLSEGLINEESLAKFRGRIGMKLRISNIFNQNVTEETLRNYAVGIGDPNPLWTDKDYAANTNYGTPVGQPNWLYSVFPTWVLQGLPGVHAYHSGNDWEFFRPILLGDRITPECEFTGFDIKESKFAGKIVMEYQRSTFRNQRDELVAKTDLWLVRAERSASKKTQKYGNLELPHPWTEEELKKAEDDCLAEEVRGDNPRYWEDVQDGEEIKPVIKGPLGITDIVAYCMGANPVGLTAHHLSLKLYKKHPAWAFRDPSTYAMEPVYAVHYNKAVTNSLGLPYPYDVGAQRHSWGIHLITNWMGDKGWLKKHYAEYRKFVYLSDAIYLRGKVKKKYLDENGEHCVDIDTWAENQRGETDVMPGHCTVILPSREKGTSPLDSRLPKK